MAHRSRFTALMVALLCAAVLLVAGAAAVGEASARRALEDEARILAAQPFARAAGMPVIVVTGSSTVRLWRNSATAFPEAQVVNTGFGGSTMDSLAAHYDGLIGRYAPDQVFIGSGDNDLARGRSTQRIIEDTAAILDRIRAELPGTEVSLIAAKPSIKRWFLRARYEELNDRFRQLAASRADVSFVDVWHPLLDDDGRLRPELYAADGLHLNGRGYRIYAAALRSAEAVGAGGA